MAWACSFPDNTRDTAAVDAAGQQGHSLSWHTTLLWAKEGKYRDSVIFKSSAINTFHLTISLKETGVHVIYLLYLHIHSIKRCCLSFAPGTLRNVKSVIIQRDYLGPSIHPVININHHLATNCIASLYHPPPGQFNGQTPN